MTNPMAITLNSRPQTCPEGSTVAQLLGQFNFTYAKIYVKVNGAHVEIEAYETTVIKAGDNVQVIHLMAGG